MIEYIEEVMERLDGDRPDELDDYSDTRLENIMEMAKLDQSSFEQFLKEIKAEVENALTPQDILRRLLQRAMDEIKGKGNIIDSDDSDY
jgi:hypothetical protein